MMGVEVRWDDDEQTLLRIDVTGRWKWDDVYKALEGIKPLIMSVSHTVNLISVMHQSSHLPGNPLFHLNNFVRNAPPNLGMMIIVGASQYAAPFRPIAQKLYPNVLRKVEFAATVEEAKELLKRL
jgi:hypothetical protein